MVQPGSGGKDPDVPGSWAWAEPVPELSPPMEEGGWRQELHVPVPVLPRQYLDVRLRLEKKGPAAFPDERL